MNRFTCLDEMWHSALRDVINSGEAVESRNGGSREIIGWSGTLTDAGRNWLLTPGRAASPVYGCAELLWYLSRSDRVSLITDYAPSYAKFAEADGRAHGAYGRRLETNIPHFDQLFLVVQALSAHPESRQAVVSLWHPSDLLHAVDVSRKDLPCTLTWQFFVRGNRLHMVATMRSNDIWLGMPYDVFCFTMIQHLVAAELGLEVGSYTHNVGSLHLYDKNAKAYDCDRSDFTVYQHCWTVRDGFAQAAQALHEWSLVRTPMVPTAPSHGGPMRDVIEIVASHHTGTDPVVCSPLFMKGLQVYADNRRAGPRR